MSQEEQKKSDLTYKLTENCALEFDELGNFTIKGDCNNVNIEAIELEVFHKTKRINEENAD